MRPLEQGSQNVNLGLNLDLYRIGAAYSLIIIIILFHSKTTLCAEVAFIHTRQSNRDLICSFLSSSLA